MASTATQDICVSTNRHTGTVENYTQAEFHPKNVFTTPVTLSTVAAALFRNQSGNCDKLTYIHNVTYAWYIPLSKSYHRDPSSNRALLVLICDRVELANYIISNLSLSPPVSHAVHHAIKYTVHTSNMALHNRVIPTYTRHHFHYSNVRH